MSKEFRPLYEEPAKKEFNVWDYTPIEPVRTASDAQIEFTIECERIRDNAREQGYQEGLQQAGAEIEALKAELNEWLEFIKNPVQLIDKALGQEIVKTIAWICEACIGIEITIQPEKLLTLVDAIKKELTAMQNERQLMMNTDDIEWLKSQLGSRNQEVIGILKADTTLKRGDFYLKSEYSELDGTLKARMDNLFALHLSNYVTESKDDTSP